jgi:hypothetical protein
MLSYFSFFRLALLAHRDETVIRHITFFVQYLCVQTYSNTSLEEKDIITLLVGGILILMPIKEGKEG